TGLKAAGQAQRPRHRHRPLYQPASRKLDTAKEPDQRRFTGPVAAQHRKLVALCEAERYAAESPMYSSFGSILLRDIDDPDHSATMYLRLSRMNSNPIKVKTASIKVV